MMRIYVGFLLIIAALSSVHGQERQTLNDWYRIELIIFQNITFSPAQTTENFSTETGNIDFLDIPSLAELQHQYLTDSLYVVDLEDATNNSTRMLNPFSRVSGDQLKLSSRHRKLSLSRHYKPVHYLAWHQPIKQGEETERVRIIESRGDLLESDSSPWDGYIQITRNRYLHIDLHIVLSAVDEYTASDTSYYHPDSRTVKYVLSEKRRSRSEELHYFDHPAFGALVTITPVEAALVDKPSGTTTPSADKTDDKGLNEQTSE